MVVGHVAPEASAGGTIALVQEGDSITIDAHTLTLQLNVDDAEIAQRRAAWTAAGAALHARRAGQVRVERVERQHGRGARRLRLTVPQSARRSGGLHGTTGRPVRRVAWRGLTASAARTAALPARPPAPQRLRRGAVPSDSICSCGGRRACRPSPAWRGAWCSRSRRPRPTRRRPARTARSTSHQDQAPTGPSCGELHARAAARRATTKYMVTTLPADTAPSTGAPTIR